MVVVLDEEEGVGRGRVVSVEGVMGEGCEVVGGVGSVEVILGGLVRMGLVGVGVGGLVVGEVGVLLVWVGCRN